MTEKQREHNKFREEQFILQSAQDRVRMDSEGILHSKFMANVLGFGISSDHVDRIASNFDFDQVSL